MASEENYGIDLHNSIEPQSLPLPPLFLESLLADGTDKPLGPVSSNLETQSASLSVGGDKAPHKSKSSRPPQLPSFKGLGILSLEPQSIPNDSAHGSYCSILNRRTVDHSFSGPDAISSARQQPQRTGSTPLLTPPADTDMLRWTAIAPSCQSPTESKENAIVAVPTLAHTSALECAASSDGNAQAENVSFGPTRMSGNETNRETENNHRAQSSVESSGSTSWLDRAVGAAGEAVLHNLT